ncbi:MAG TPA: addiction module protein [Pirellulaceae bacterium]|nr:addiction module protein [Pirellulaceae bacterium]
MTAQAIAAAALALPPESRVTLAEVLLNSVKGDSVSLSSEWLAEIEDRIAAYRRGELATYSREEVMQSLEADSGR